MCVPTEAAEVSQCLPEGRERIYIAFPRQVGGKVYFGPTPCYRLVPVRAAALHADSSQNLERIDEEPPFQRRPRHGVPLALEEEHREVETCPCYGKVFNLPVLCQSDFCGIRSSLY